MSLRAQHARGGRQGSPPPVQLAVLALLIERRTYVYELSQRFDDRFGELLPVATGTVYKAVDGLVKRGLVERMALDGGDDGIRPPKPPYRATADGARTLRQSLADDMRGDPFQAEMLQRLMSVSVQDARALLDLVDRYERLCLEQIGALPPAVVPVGEPRSSFVSLRGELVAEERRLALEAQMKWVAYARRRIGAVNGGAEESG